MLTDILDSLDLPFESTFAKTRSYQDPIESAELINQVGFVQILRVNHDHFHFDLILSPCMDKSLQDRLISIGQFHILAHQSYTHPMFWILMSLEESIPLGQLRSLIVREG